MVSGGSALSNSFVSPYGNLFVSQSGWWSGSLVVPNSFVVPYNDSFVSQSGWWCPALRLSRIHLCSLIAIHLSPSLAEWYPALRPSFLFAVTCFPSCFSHHLSPDLNICLSTYLFSIISLPQWWCLILLPFRICACLPSFVSDHVSPTSWVFPFICSPTGGVLFLFQHAFVCD